MSLFKAGMDLCITMLVKCNLKFKGRYEKKMAEEKFKNVVLKNKGTLKLEGDGIIYEPEKLVVGSYVFIGKSFFIRAAGGVSIGDYTHISRNVVIHTVNHNIYGELLPYDRTEILKPIKIGSYVWIGMNVCILPGVEIGDGAVIGMGTVISKNVNPGEIVVGATQRVIGRRDPNDTADKLKNEKYLKF